MEDLVGKADDAPPKDLVRNFVQLLCELVENSRAALSKKVASVIVHKLHFLLSL